MTLKNIVTLGLVAILTVGTAGAVASCEPSSGENNDDLGDAVSGTYLTSSDSSKQNYSVVKLTLTRDSDPKCTSPQKPLSLLELFVGNGYIVGYTIDIPEGLEGITFTEIYTDEHGNKTKEEIHTIKFNVFYGYGDVRTEWYKNGELMFSDQQANDQGMGEIYPHQFGVNYQILHGKDNPGKYTYKLEVNARWNVEYHAEAVILVKSH